MKKFIILLQHLQNRLFSGLLPQVLHTWWGHIHTDYHFNFMRDSSVWQHFSFHCLANMCCPHHYCGLHMILDRCSCHSSFRYKPLAFPVTPFILLSFFIPNVLVLSFTEPVAHSAKYNFPKGISLSYLIDNNNKSG